MRACPICKSNESKIYMKEDAWNNMRDKIQLRKCTKCKFIFSYVIKEDLEKYYRMMGIESKGLSYQDVKNQALNEGMLELVREISSYIETDKKQLLDFGCSVGKLSLIFKENGWDAFGVEPCIIFRDIHKKLGIKTSSDIKIYINDGKEFDLLIIKDVLEHLVNPVETQGYDKVILNVDIIKDK